MAWWCDPRRVSKGREPERPLARALPSRVQIFLAIGRRILEGPGGTGRSVGPAQQRAKQSITPKQSGTRRPAGGQLPSIPVVPAGPCEFCNLSLCLSLPFVFHDAFSSETALVHSSRQERNLAGQVVTRHPCFSNFEIRFFACQRQTACACGADVIRPPQRKPHAQCVIREEGIVLGA